ncbi:manganese and iron superoxide dismutase [Annulohypoxylon maeteangense]|uniref:manganese and iron superoxide dismutase n=1 Tax=Annulohypoxylon maeteangense TaxID=1927788 RepID=UPI002008BD37|nr:manganese and iron superoxide dismutase [Annulohypoxylon maeteangense]KAI0890535.1 manganese and iron superoxide dismutase [Annulohypoxylon maeteangense]
MLRPRLRIPRASRPWRPAISSRQIHFVPALRQFNPDEGVPGLLSSGGFDLAWTQYMAFVMEKLNIMIAEDDLGQQDPLSIVKATAREPSQAHIFNYASMAYNNHFFFENIARVEQEPGAPTGADRIPEKLKEEFTRHFSSVETLRREFLSTAVGMFGPGFVWLVKVAQSDQLRILPTYLAGTPFTAAHWRRQGVDMNTQGPASREVVDSWMSRAQTGAGANVGSRFVDPNLAAPGGTDVIPLLCLNTWEHVWLRDYGVGANNQGGKRQYVMNWWEVIDWDKVEDRANLRKVAFKT